ncbi:MAG: MATE family efflux transporter [Oscillospiraceae bacterium]|nr:MATE family efflux transporter [Oscillospiraceae bacterium]
MFEHSRSFFRTTLTLMLPVVLQQLITIGINFMDNLMIGGFGEIQISAASFSNQFYSFFQFICMGLGSGAVVMSAQFWGRRDQRSIRITSAMALRVTLGVCLVFELLSLLSPALVLTIFTGDAAIIRAGTPYLRLIGLTFLLSGLSSTATYLLRSTGSVRVPLIGSAGAFVLNIFFNWVFIFGKFGAPRLELVGAAVGTVIARVFEFCFVFGYFVLRDQKFQFRLGHFALFDAQLRRQYVKFSIPVIVSDTLLGLSLSLVGVIYGHISAEISAANAIASSVIQLLTVLNVGMAGASAIVIGNTIGEGDIPRAKREGNSYILLSFLFGLALILPLILLEGPYVGLYTIAPETQAIVHSMFIINSFFLPGQTIAYVISKGILRGGGDTRFLLMADSSCVWLISLPLGGLAGLVWHLSPAWVFFLLRVEFPLKGIVCFIRYCSGRWIKRIAA